MRIATYQIRAADPSGANLPDGQYVAAVSGGIFTGLQPVVAPSTGSPLVVIDENGNPGLIFAADGDLIYTEDT